MRAGFLPLFFLFVAAASSADTNTAVNVNNNPAPSLGAPSQPAPPPPGQPVTDDASDMADLGREMQDFHKQAEGMLKQLEQATGTAQQNGQPPSQLDLARQKAMKLAADDRFLKSAGDLWGHPDRNKMLLIQLGFFLFMLIVKAWRQSKTQHWFKKMLVGFFFTLLTLVGISYVIPLIVLGEPFAVFTGTLFKVFIAG